MKKILLFILITILFLLTSCNINNLNTNQTSNTSGDSTNIDYYESQSDDMGYVDEPAIDFYTFEEYELYFGDMEELPPGFVPYDAVREIGEFKSLVILCVFDSGMYNWGLYSFIDENGANILLYYEPLEIGEIPSNVIFPSSVSEDLRTLKTEESGIYTCDDLQYRYFYGKLYSITWVSDNIRFILVSGDSELGDYEIGAKQTFVQSMLNPQTAASAVNQFNANVSDCLNNQNTSSKE